MLKHLLPPKPKPEPKREYTDTQYNIPFSWGVKPIAPEAQFYTFGLRPNRSSDDGSEAKELTLLYSGTAKHGSPELVTQTGPNYYPPRDKIHAAGAHLPNVVGPEVFHGILREVSSLSPRANTLGTHASS